MEYLTELTKDSSPEDKPTRAEGGQSQSVGANAIISGAVAQNVQGTAQVGGEHAKFCE